MAYPPITVIPTPPNRLTDSPTEFSNNTDAFLSALPQFRVDVNNFGGWAETQGQQIEYNATIAQNSASEAIESSQLSISNANFKGRWIDQTGSASVPYTVHHNSRYWQLLNDIPDIASSEPGVSGDWDISVPIKANTADALAGTNDTEWMSPLKSLQQVQQFGLGGANPISNTTNANDLTLGSFAQIEGVAADLEALNYPPLGIGPTLPVSFNVLTFGPVEREAQIAVENIGLGGKPKGRMFLRVLFDTWQTWQEIFTTGSESVLLAKYYSTTLFSGAALSVHGKYHLRGGNATFTLPNVTGLNSGDAVSITKAVGQTPTVQVQGGSGEQILIGGSGSTTKDTSVVFDVNSEIVFVWNSTDWEV